MATNYDQYYKASLKSGLLYQDFVVDLCWQTIGLAIVQYSSKAYQETVGESRTGAEIKFNEKYGQTRNLWIELAEKAKPRPGPYAQSGINREDNTWLFVTGDYDTVFIFAKSLLKGLAASGRYSIRENHTKTSRGFLLGDTDARRYAAVVLEPNAKNKVAKIAGDLSSLGSELHAIAKSNPGQGTLFNKFA